MGRPHGRNGQITRTLQILLMLERSRCGLTLRQMAEDSCVCDRTIRRDLDALQAAGVPLVESENPQERRWRVLDWRTEAA